MKIKRLISSFSILLFLGFSVQNQNAQPTKSNDVPKVEPLTPEDITSNVKKEVKDSLANAFNEEQNLTVTVVNKLDKKRQKKDELRESYDKALLEFIKVSQEALKKQNDTRIIVVNKTPIEQIKDGELKIVKDSVCVKKKFLGSKCARWNYKFYLVDNKGRKQAL
jgi:vacuolar-type H+-ATPase subunit F/Vma7